MRTPPLLISILAAISACGEPATGCFEVEATLATCPAGGSVDPDDLWIPGDCDRHVVSVTGEGEREKLGLDAGEVEACCYPVRAVDPTPLSDCIVGRPYREGDRVLLASCEGATSEVAAAWARAAAGEHASVAAFAALALQLLHHGAPTDLLLAVSEAQADEVRHTQACLDEARRLGSDVKLGAFPFLQPVNAAVSLKALAGAAAREGCVAETLAAHLATEAAALTADVRVRGVLSTIAADEARHAVLSWRIAAWAMAQGGEDVREAVQMALAEAPPRLDTHELSLRTGVAVAVLDRVVAQGVAQVVRPAASALFA